MTGRLELVATPIGNLGDLAPRAVESLRDVDRILCEDTRRTRSLLSAFSLASGGRLESFHEHNEFGKTPGVIDRLLAGERVALVSDAGTPGISDPGARLVAAAVAAGIEVTALPGPSAVLAALVVSGLPTDRFVMEGFLPRRGADRRARLAGLVDEQRTVVLYESPRRVPATVTELAEVLGAERPAVVARELTKLHEEIWRGSLGEASAHYRDAEVRGEVVLVIGGAVPVARQATEAEVLVALQAATSAGLSTRDASAAVSQQLGVARRAVYDLAVGARRTKE
jgi:16S rRNA (cytidine1402-2'-O)-methyltransferase